MQTLYLSCLPSFLRFLPAIMGLVFGASLGAQTFMGSVTISTQADLDAFVPPGGGTYDTVNGNFIIRPIDDPNTNQILTDFTNVTGLSAIDGELRIDNYETEQIIGNPLAEFTALESIGELRIFDNATFNSGIINLSSTTLRAVNATFEIGNNDNLEGIADFPALLTVSASFIVRNNPQLVAITPTNLTNIGGNFRINDNDALINLDDFENITSFSGGFFIRGNGTLSNIDGFANSTSTIFNIPALVVENNPQLSTIGATPGPNIIGFRVLDSLIISGNIAVTSISTNIQAGSAPIDQNLSQTLSAVRIIDNDNLESTGVIFDKSYTLTIGEVAIIGNRDLNNIGGQFMNVTGSIIITDNDNLVEGANFAATTNLSGDLTITNNQRLRTFQRLGGTARPDNGLRTVTGDILISSNPALFTLQGLRRLESAASLSLTALGSSTVSGTLSSLDELVRLANLTDFFTITSNPNLSDCCEPFCEVTVAGAPMDGFNDAVTITGNTGECEDKQTAVNACADEPGKGCLAAAPVEWLAFTGSLGTGSIDLDFSTATESDNDYFQIERSVAGGAFEAIGQIDGAGDSQTALSYSFSDYDYSSGLNYYRIRQVDFDGTEAFSDVIVVDAGGSKLALTLFPNPANGSNVTLQLGRDWNADRVTAQIYSVAGQFVREIRATGNSRLFLPTADLQAGMYAVRVSDGNRTVTTRLTVR